MADYDPSQRLTTWKEIGEYIGRDSRTARRYESERQLPVRRMPNGDKSTVYAIRHELDRWLAGHESLPSDLVAEPSPPPPVLGEQALFEPELLHGAGRIQPPVPVGKAQTVPHWLSLLAASAIGALALALSVFATFGLAFRTPSGSLERIDPNVQRLCTSGWYAWERRTPDDLRRAVDDFTQAIVLDPHYAPAYVGLADSYNLMPQFGAMSPAEAYPRARAAAERAVFLSPNSAGAHRALAFVTFWWGHDKPTAMREFKTAIRLDPKAARTYLWYANALSEVQDAPGALANIKRALALDPSSSPIRASEGLILIHMGRFSDARLVLNEVETVQPDFIPAYDYMTLLLAEEGDDVGFLQQAERAAMLRKNSDAAKVVEAAQRALESGGHTAMLGELTQGWESLALAGKQSPYGLAVLEVQQGRRLQAINALAQLVKDLDPATVGLATDTPFASLHGEPAFERLLLRIHPSH